MSHTFLTTRYTDDIYQLIVKLCAEDIKLRDKKIKIKKIELRKKPDFLFLLTCLWYLILGKFWNKEKTALLKYKNINFGLKLLSITFRSFDSYVSLNKYYYNLFKNIYLISKIFYTADFYEKKYDFNCVYIDHMEYLNGIYFEVFKNKKRTFYTNHYPNNIIKTKKKNIEITNRINFKKKKFTKNEKKKIWIIAKKVYGSIKDYLPWMRSTKWSSKNYSNLKKYDYIIYAHSFTDSQLQYGFDGFTNTLEWLEYTILELQKKGANFIVKPHPNFYTNISKNKKNNLALWDRKIYLNLKNKIKNQKNILFIDKPILNKSLISKLNDKCLVITKHGSIQLEMVYHGFKVISSAKNLIDPKYSLSNSWNNREEYKKLLNKKWKDLSFGDEESFLTVMEFLFIDENSTFGKNYYLNVLKNQMLKKKITKKNSPYGEVLSKFGLLKNKQQLIKKIKIPIKWV